MKTLDEVISWMEDPIMCNVPPYKDDALHYLKEYRSDKAMWEADRKGLLDWIEQYKEAREKHQQAVIELKKNPPLDWDELKAMEGKPIWTKDVLHEKGEWLLIHIVEGDDIWYVDKWTGKERLNRDGYGTLWKAYRKEIDGDAG